MIKRIPFLILVSLFIAGTSTAQTVAKPTGARGVPAPVPKNPTVPVVQPPISKPGPGEANPNPINEPTHPAEPTMFKWHATGGLVACREPEDCVRLPFPKPIGKPIAVKRGPFLDKKHAVASMLVESKDQYSLCYVSSLDANAVNECHRVKAPVIKGAKIRVITYPGKGSTLSYSLDPDEIKGKSRAEIRGLLTGFIKAVRETQATASKSAARRYSGDKLPMEHMTNEDGDGGGSCMSDSDGGGWCDGGGEGYDGGGGSGGDWGQEPWPEEPTSDDNWGGDEPVQTPDGGSGDDDQLRLPGIPVPVPQTTEPEPTIEDDSCLISPNAAHCVIITGQRDPNRTDPDTGAQLPPSQPDDGNFWCGVPIVKWFVCGDPGPEAAPQPTLPPFEWPTRPDAAEPLPRDEEGYREEVDRCDADLARDESDCGLRYTLLGGPVYEDMLDQGVKLTPREKKMLKDAKEDYRSCKKVASDTWGQCYEDARKKFPR